MLHRVSLTCVTDLSQLFRGPPKVAGVANKISRNVVFTQCGTTSQLLKGYCKSRINLFCVSRMEMISDLSDCATYVDQYCLKREFCQTVLELSNVSTAWVHSLVDCAQTNKVDSQTLPASTYIKWEQVTATNTRMCLDMLTALLWTPRWGKTDNCSCCSTFKTAALKQSVTVVSPQGAAVKSDLVSSALLVTS